MMKNSIAIAILTISTTFVAAMEPLSPPNRDNLHYMIYFSDRCAALYIALASQGGEKQLGSRTYMNMVNGATFFSSASSVGRAHRQGISLEDAAEQVRRDVRNIAELYIARLNDNYARSGNAIVGEPLLENDFETCSLVLSTIEE
jgi:hypothetical protein